MKATQIAIFLTLITAITLIPHADAKKPYTPIRHTATTTTVTAVTTTTTTIPPTYRHGDCTWVEPVALAAGWEKHQIPKLINIIQRESGCCPTRIGGSVVDANCNLIRMATLSHPSDSGLLQINGINYNPNRNSTAPICTQMRICEQQPLLDAATNLRAGRLLFDLVGWSPWMVRP